MTESSTEGLDEKKLPRRDWILLPVLGLTTIVLLVGSTELIGRHIYTQLKTEGEDCMVLNRSSNTLGGIPNSVCWEKIREGKLIEYRLNSTGYRSDTNFGPKLPGTFRIVVIGSSFVAGARVPIEEAFATMLSPELSRMTGQKVEIVNLGMAGSAAYPSIVALRFKDALAAEPDMILRILNPWDIQNESATPSAPAGTPAQDTNTSPPAQKSLVARFISRVFDRDWLAAYMLRHFLYESQSQYVKSFLRSGGTFVFNGGFLKAEPNAEWKKQLLQFESEDAGVEDRVKAAGVPLVSVFIPLRAQAAMISMEKWPAEFDPFKLSNELRSIITRHGGIYIDILPDFRNIPNPEEGYYPLEGHLNPRGHAIIARLLAKELMSGAVPALRVSAQLRPVQQYGN
jgi:hypothetical protein